MVSMLNNHTQQWRDLIILLNPPPPPHTQLYLPARCVQILPEMKDHCLIHVGQLCGDGFAVNFDTKNIFPIKGKHVLIGYIDATNGLYLIYFDDPQQLPSVANHSDLALSTHFPRPSNICAYSVHETTTKKDLLLYLHQAAWIPVP